jgi:hypothetical protein
MLPVTLYRPALEGSMSRLSLCLLLAACTPAATAVLDEDTSDGLDDTIEDTDTIDDTDTDTEPEPEPEPEYAYAGDYTGDMDILALSDWGDYELGTCDLDISVDDEGELQGTADCEISSGWGDPQEYSFDMSGEVTDEGDVSGEMPIDIGRGGDYTMEFVGTADDEGMDLDFSVVFEQGGSFEMTGEANLDRD